MASEVSPANLRPGDQVQFSSQEGEVIAVERSGERWSVRVAVEGLGPRVLLAPPTRFTRVESPLSRARANDFDSPVSFDLLTEATRLSLAYEYDRLVSLSNSRAKLEPYQVTAVHQVAKAWEQRFLIADDVGLGKTIEVGMIIKELKARHRADRVLVICPAGLALQWRREMAEKFDERFEVLSSEMLRQWRATRPAGEDLSTRYPYAIISIDTAKPRDENSHAQDVTEAHWDVVVFDEAHKVAQHGSGEQIIARHRLARDLAPSCDALLLLSATPHDGDANAFWSLISLLDPLRFDAAADIGPEALASIMIRRNKQDIRKADGSLLFKPRWVNTTAVEFTDDELDLYNEVTQYVREGYRSASEMQDTAVGFLMVLLQKRMVSSIAAIRRSLERRLIRLEHPEAAALTPKELRELRDREADEEALADDEREKMQEKLEAARLKLGRPEHQMEIAQVRRLVDLARAITVDSKALELRTFLDGVFAESPDEKVLIFTEYTDTLDYLRDEVLVDFGPMAQIYGGMNMEARQQQEAYFASPEVRLMLATDAAGEGINLQFCHLMVNYELPWNPNRIEQRIGRLHRYGQAHDVRVYNLQVTNTREGQILAKLLAKLSTIEKQLGGYAPNVLGLSAPGEAVNLHRLSDLIINALAEDEAPEVTAEHVAQAIDDRLLMQQQIEEGLFMPLHRFDKDEAAALIQRSESLTPSNADIEAFVNRYFEAHGGRIEPTRGRHVFRLRTPPDLVDGRRVQPKYDSVTFDRETARREGSHEVQFIAFGHPLLEAIIQDCRSRTPSLRGAAAVKVVAPEVMPVESGIVFNYTIACTDSQGVVFAEEMHPVFVSVDGVVDQQLAPALLRAQDESHDGAASSSYVTTLVELLPDYETIAKAGVSEVAAEVHGRVQAERERQAQASLDSLYTFRKTKAARLKVTIAEFQRRLENGEDMGIALRNAGRELSQLDTDCRRRAGLIEQRRYVQVSAPELLNVALLVRRGTG